MKNYPANWSLIFIFLTCISFGGCTVFEKMGKSLTRGLSNNADSVGYNLVKGAGNRLGAPATSDQLKQLLDSVITAMGLSTNRQVLALRDSILNQETRNRIILLREDLLGEGTRTDLARIRNELLGEKTRLMVEQIIATGRNQILSDSINQKLAQFRDILLGPETNQGIRSIVDSAMSTLINRYHKDLKPELKSNIGFLKRNAVWFIVILALISSAIIAYVWRQRRRYLELSSMLTYQIHKIPDQRIYDALTSSIQDQARMKRLEPQLRELLSQQGILGEESWKSELVKKTDQK